MFTNCNSRFQGLLEEVRLQICVCGTSVTFCIELGFGTQHGSRMRVNVFGEVIYLFVYPLSPSPLTLPLYLPLKKPVPISLNSLNEYCTNLP